MIPEPTERDVSLARRGDRQALQRLLLAHYDRVRLTVQSVLPAKLQGEISEEDLIQEAFTEAVRSIPTLTSDDPRAFRKWLCRIAKRRAINQVRTRLARKRGGAHTHEPIHAGESAGDLASGLEPLLTRSHRSPRSALAHAEQLEHLRLVLGSLESEQREVLHLRFNDQMPYEQIGLRLNKSKEAAQMVCFRALRILRSMLPPR